MRKELSQEEKLLVIDTAMSTGLELWITRNREDNEDFSIVFSINDFFAYACADCEELTADNLHVFMNISSEYMKALKNGSTTKDSSWLIGSLYAFIVRGNNNIRPIEYHEKRFDSFWSQAFKECSDEKENRFTIKNDVKELYNGILSSHFINEQKENEKGAGGSQWGIGRFFNKNGVIDGKSNHLYRFDEEDMLPNYTEWNQSPLTDDEFMEALYFISRLDVNSDSYGVLYDQNGNRRLFLLPIWVKNVGCFEVTPENMWMLRAIMDALGLHERVRWEATDFAISAYAIAATGNKMTAIASRLYKLNNGVGNEEQDQLIDVLGIEG